MIRKSSLLIIIFISVFLMSLSVYAFSGVARNGSGGHSSFGGGRLGGRVFGGHSSFGSGGSGGYSNPINHKIYPWGR
ncbi:MAG: hypothetical protein ACM3SR_00575 [Ignavibacteriales bacterium]